MFSSTLPEGYASIWVTSVAMRLEDEVTTLRDIYAFQGGERQILEMARRATRSGCQQVCVFPFAPIPRH